MKTDYKHHGYRYDDDHDDDDNYDHDEDDHGDNNSHVDHPVQHQPSPPVIVNETKFEIFVEVIVEVNDRDPITNYIYGTRWNDYLVGTDSDDVIYGYKGNDTIIDGKGSDRLYGGKGRNTFQLSADQMTDVVFITRDKKVDVIEGIGLEDRIDILGGKLSFDSTDRGIEIFSKGKLCAIYKGDLSLEQIQSLTV